MGKRFIAAVLIQAREEKIEIVLVPQQFTENFRIVSHLFQDRSVQWLQNSQLVPQIFYSLAPGVKLFRVRVVDGPGECAVAAPVAFAFGGVPGDIFVTGDWLGTGTSRAGIYR